MVGRVEGKVCIVTGGASGIGAASAERLGREGAKVVVADINLEGAKAKAKAIGDAGGQATAIAFDLSNEESIKSLVAQTVAAYGRVDVLFNNAAAVHLLGQGLDSSFEVTSAATWDLTFEINVRGMFLLTKYVAPEMVKVGGGSIINTASESALNGVDAIPAYSTSKAAVIALSRNIATFYGTEGIRCNALSPGMIRTPPSDAAGYTNGSPFSLSILENITLGRFGRPEDIANLLLFLASDESSWITG